MPADQQGSVYPTSTGYGIRYTDEYGIRRRQAGFSSSSKARRWFRDVELPRQRGRLVDEPLTLAEFSDRYLARYAQQVQPVTVQTLRNRLVRPLREFGDVKLSELRTGELAAFEATLPPRFRYAVVRALRQVLDAAVAWEYLAKNPAKATGRNPQPEVRERTVLEPVDVDRLAGELRSPYDVAVVVGAWCYLRPSELLSLERRDLHGDELHVRGTKTRRSKRAVPVPLKAAEALSRLPRRLDSRLLFPSPSANVYDLHNWSRREFKWAVEAAGLNGDVTPYTLRHAGLSWALAAGVPVSDVAKFGGTSVEMLDLHYHHLLSSSSDAAKQRLDAFSSRSGQDLATAEDAEN